MTESVYVYEGGLSALICYRAAEIAEKTSMTESYEILTDIISGVDNLDTQDIPYIASEFLWRASPAVGELNAVLFIKKVFRGYIENIAM